MWGEQKNITDAKEADYLTIKNQCSITMKMVGHANMLKSKWLECWHNDIGNAILKLQYKKEVHNNAQNQR